MTMFASYDQADQIAQTMNLSEVSDDPDARFVYRVVPQGHRFAVCALAHGVLIHYL